MTAIKFDQVSKQYTKGKKLLKEALIEVARFKRAEQFWALKDISLAVEPGEVVGVLGPNGSGKSTLLKLIAGVTEPTTGLVTVKGRIAPLIELGAGFHAELTGRENIYINGSILGLKIKEIDRRLKEIIDFAELVEFIDTPIKHYSSGMYMRLGFSVAIHVDPDILLIDEILAVGDAPFQAKCLRAMNQFKNQEKTMVIVSHASDLLESFCTRGLVIWQGSLAFSGPMTEALKEYRRLLTEQYGNHFNHGYHSHPE
ncbi:hypothetical protein A2W24_05685 [Microgenomates group bacterium RBG_16_45_19]|nr:MAG: hypothetical protein A2W24_05685 [Microgenomates group bacterium RBG_16_45_19]